MVEAERKRFIFELTGLRIYVIIILLVSRFKIMIWFIWENVCYGFIQNWIIWEICLCNKDIWLLLVPTVVHQEVFFVRILKNLHVILPMLILLEELDWKWFSEVEKNCLFVWSWLKFLVKYWSIYSGLKIYKSSMLLNLEQRRAHAGQSGTFSSEDG